MRQSRPRPAVDDIDWRVKKQIDQPRVKAGLSQEAIEQDRGFGPDARQNLGTAE